MSSRMVSVLVCFSLLAASAPAAPRTIVDVSVQWNAGLAFWLRAHHVRGALLDLVAESSTSVKRQETQPDRDARVTRIAVSPDNVTVNVDDYLQLAAVGLDQSGQPVGGVKFDWSVYEDAHGRFGQISQTGEFHGLFPGHFRVTVKGATKQAQVLITVLDGPRRHKPTDRPVEVRPVSNRDRATSTAALKNDISLKRVSTIVRRSRSKVLAHAGRATAVPIPPDDGWNSGNFGSSSDPKNRVGSPAGGAIDGGAGSSNFQLSAPIYSSSGRGINITLSANYNSRLWNKSGSQISFDIDRGWPAPGWSLGFGKILSMGTAGGSMIVDADGTRHNYTGTIHNYGASGMDFNGQTTDGSFIDYYTYSWSDDGVHWGYAKLANGTMIIYNQMGPGGIYPTAIKDQNGNMISISYVNSNSAQIQTITDTLGRAINFYYDANNLLTAITGPGLNGSTRTLVRFHYRQLSLNYSFSGLTPAVNNSYPWVIDAIYYPGTNTGYWFGDSDSYSSYGMIAKAIEQRGMSISVSSLNEMGSVVQGSLTRKQVYNYPLYVGDSSGTQSSNLADAPTYTSSTESWTRDGTNVDSATTLYSVNENATPRTVEITLPNGTKSKQYSHNSPGSYLDGLVYSDETRNSSGVLLRSSTSNWEQGAYSSPRPTQVQTTNYEIGRSTRTTFGYGTVYNQVTDVRNFGYDDELLRWTHTTYQNSGIYTYWHIFNLPLTVEIHDGNNNRITLTEYQYDGQSLTDRPDVIMHDHAYNPYCDQDGFCWTEPDWNDCDCTVCRGEEWGEVGDGYCNQNYVCPCAGEIPRGNVTQITNYATVNNSTATGPIVETRRYDITGNLVTATTSCCEQSSLNYTVDTQYEYPLSTTRGAASDPYAQITTSASYDFNTGLELTTTDANGRPSSTSYDANTLRPTSVALPTGAHTDYGYDDSAMTITSTTYLAASEGGGIADQNVKLLNGRGQVRQEKALGNNSVWDFVDTVFDSMGQVSQQTRPYRSGETQQWSITTYDALGRTKTVTTPDGSVSQSFYNEGTRPAGASNNAGESIRVQDTWGRERWGRNDVQGRLVEVVEPDPNGAGSVAFNGLVTTYGYDTLGNLTSVTQGSQTRSFMYDALGRLTAQKLAEKSATLDDSGIFVGIGGSGARWSDFFRYDIRSNVVQHRDARGVKINYWYFNPNNHQDPGDGTTPDPLGRLQAVTYDTSGDPNHSLIPGDNNYYLKVLDAATVTYQYRAKSSGADLKDVTQLTGIATADISSESYSFDTEGRVNSKTLTLTSRPAYPFVTDYIFDSLSRVSDVRYPAEYGNGSAPRRLVHQSYDVASRLSGLSVDGQSHASNITYNAASQTSSVNVGVSGSNQITESYTYNAQTGLLDSQTVTRNSSVLLNLSYDYADTNGKRTGQLVKIQNNLDHSRDRGYEYDALGRLKRATGGQNINWVQRYTFDRFGNRNNVYSYTAENYIKNFYLAALNRAATGPEVQSWLGTLQSAYSQGQSQFLAAIQSLGTSLFTSQEYANRNRDNHWFVYDLYKAYLWRDPDSGGWAAWEAAVASYGRDVSRNAFATSTEFVLKVNGTSPNSPSGGVAPRDGWEAIWYEDSTNRIAVPGWSYDAAGNQTRVQTGPSSWEVFQYDGANRLVRVLQDDRVSVLASYTYGSDNQRLISSEPPLNGGQGLRTYYVAEGGSIAAEYTENFSSVVPAWSKSYVYLGARLLSTLTPNGSGGELVDYHHPDRLGTRLVTNAQNTNYSEQVTMPFGTAFDLESGTSATNRRFTSYDRSTTTGLDYAINRHYDAQQGRFTQVDPIGMESTTLDTPQTLNLYAYCANDPVNGIDPDGLFFGKLFKWIGKALKMLSIVALVVMTLIVFAPASSFVFKAALWMFFHVLGPLSQIPVLGALVPLGTIGSPQWNPQSRGPFGDSFQGQARDADDPDIDPEDIIRIYTTALRRRIGEFFSGIYDATATVASGAKKAGITFSQCFTYQEGIDDFIDVVKTGFRSAGVAGLPINPKSVVRPGESAASSPFAKFSRFAFRRLPAITTRKIFPSPTFNKLPASLFRMTPHFGRSFGRVVPLVGQALLVYDGVQISRCIYRRW